MLDYTNVITDQEILLRLIIWTLLSLIIWLEREYRHQPAWVRTHILIWLGSTLLMIISILVPEVYNSNINDPWRIAAQVVSWVWFLWAWAILKMWLNTKWLTTAANIWVTAAIWLTVWAWLYIPAIFVTCLILLNLVFIAKIKTLFVKKTTYYTIDLKLDKSKTSDLDLLERLENLPIEILTKNLKEDEKFINIKVVSRVRKDVNIFALHKKLKTMNKLFKVSINEVVK